MNVIPAIDIMDGGCVQLVGGMPGTEEYFGDPVEMALEWAQAGAKMLHVIDLDAALGRGDNLDVALRVCSAAKLPVQFGGGIRDYERASYLLDSGIDRIILGTMAILDRGADFYNIKRLGQEYGPERLVVAVDSRNAEVVVSGWQEYSGLKAADLAMELEDLVWGLLYTDVDVEGQMRGVNLGGIEEVVSASKLPVMISGGVSSLEDLRKIREVGAWGVVLGKALYAGKLDFKDALSFQ